MSIPAKVAIGVVRAYQWTIRPVIGANCRFWPSCSEYAIEAFRGHGALRGAGLTTRRILRCNPWHEGGIDLVPPCGSHGSPATDQGRHGGQVPDPEGQDNTPQAGPVRDHGGKDGPAAGRDRQTGH